MASIDLGEVAKALPTASFKSPKLGAIQPGHTPRPERLPECFGSLLRHANSEHPHHRRQRIVLDAVVVTIPTEVATFSGSAASAVYLAAILSALKRYISTTGIVRLSDSRVHPSTKTSKSSKKHAGRQRLAETRLEDEVLSLAVSTLVAPDSNPTTDITMNVQDGGGIQPTDENMSAQQTTGMVAAFVSLIALAVQGCSHAILNLKAVDIFDTIFLAYTHVTGHASVAHHSNIVIASVLSVIAPPTWSNPTVQTAFLYLIRHSSDNDEAFRTNSKKSLMALMRCPRSQLVAKRASAPAASFFVTQLQSLGNLLRGDLSDQNRVTVLLSYRNYLSCLGDYGEFLLPSDASRCCQEIFSIASLGDSLSSLAYSTLGGLFSKRVTPADATNTDFPKPLMPLDKLSSLVLMALNYRLPDECDDELVIAYATCVAVGVAAIVEYFGHSPPPDDFIYKPVRRLFEALDPSNGPSAVSKMVSRGFFYFLENRWFLAKPMVLTTLGAFVDAKYRPLWSDVIPVLRKYLETGMCAGNAQMNSGVRLLISTVVSNRAVAIEKQDMKAQTIMESVLKSICRGGASSLLLSKCEVKLDANTHITNGWVLAILRDNIAGGILSSFSKELLPLAESLDAVCRQKKVEQRVVEAKNVEMYILQIWALLPGFCTNPSDLLQDGVMTKAFQAVHTCLIYEKLEVLFNFGMSGLRQLSRSVLALSQDDPTSRKTADAFSSRLKKLLPTIIERLCLISDDKRSMGLDAMTVACKATNDASVVSGLLKRCIKQILEFQLQLSNSVDDTGVKDTKRKQQISTDLAIAIVESDVLSLGTVEIEYLEKAISPFLMEKSEGVMQKKAYRFISKLIGSNSAAKTKNEVMGLARKVAEAHEMVAAGAKAFRLSWITAVANYHVVLSEGEKEDFLTELNTLFLSEVMLSVRDVSEKTRSAAYNALISLARGWYNLNQGSNMEGLEKFLMSVAAGFGGKSPAMLAGTLGSIGRILQTFKYEIESDAKLRMVVDSLFTSKVADESAMEDCDKEKNVIVPGPVGILMRHSSVEVQRGGVNLVKLMTKCCCSPDGRLLELVPGILPGLLHVAARSNKRETRLKVRLVLERLIRKCGFDEIACLFPVEHKKLLTAVRKQYARSMVKKQMKREQRTGHTASSERQRDRDDNDMDEDSDGSSLERDLVDGEVGDVERDGEDFSESEDEVVNLLESKRKVSGKMETLKRVTNAKKGGDEVKYSEDGKPIFEESEDGETANVSSDEDEDDEDEVDKTGMSGSGTNGVKARLVRKRKFGMVAGDGSDRYQKRSKGWFGEEFRGKRGFGDVKRKGKEDPFAYVPLGAGLFGGGAGRGTSGKRRRGALDVIANSGPSRSARTHMRKLRGGRFGVPGRR